MRVLIVGCGYVGTAVARALVHLGHDVHGVRRSPEGLQALASENIQPLAGDVSDPASVATLVTPIKPANSGVMGPTKIEKSIMEAIKTAKLGLPDWNALAKQEHVSLDYLMQRVDWMRRMNMIR